MSEINNKSKIAESKGIDLPVMKVYLAGRISGDHIEKCLVWRKQIVNHYNDYNGKGQYPISFLCPLNSGEDKTLDKLGLKSHIPSNLIYDKDLLSIQHSDVIIANMEDFFEDGIEFHLRKSVYISLEDKAEGFDILQDKILNRRENMGTLMELGISMYLQKPIILIVPENRKHIYENHPFTKRASVIVSSVEELLEKKWLNILYKSIASTVY
jgi:nucleoside 2-deoxyribosyltransferase